MTNAESAPWQGMSGEAAGLVEQILTASMDANFRTMDSLYEVQRADTKMFAEAFLELYALVRDDEGLPRYTLQWLRGLSGIAAEARGFLTPEIR